MDKNKGIVPQERKGIHGVDTQGRPFLNINGMKVDMNLVPFESFEDVTGDNKKEDEFHSQKYPGIPPKIILLRAYSEYCSPWSPDAGK